MRRLRVLTIILLVILSQPPAAYPEETGPPATTESNDSPPSDDPSFTGDNTPNKVITKSPDGPALNEVTDRRVPEDFDPPDTPTAEDPCRWVVAVADDSQQGSAVVTNVDIGFEKVLDFLPKANRKTLGGTSRAYSATGRWWNRICPDEENPGFDIIDLIPEGEPVTIEELILRSLGVLDPEIPGFTVNPEGKQLVQFRSLFWLEDGYWQTQRTDTQTAGRVVSTVNLIPEETEWDPGDGTDPITCDGPGEIWEPGMKGETFYCGHTYQTVEGQPFTLTMTVKFDINVTATVGGNPAPENLGPYEFLTRTDTTQIGTREIQVVETN